MTKTVNLNGDEVKVEGLGGYNTVVKNLGGSAIFASAYPGITEGADNVVEIPAASGEVVFDTNGTIYLSGSGKVQCTGTDSAAVNFNQPSSSSGDGGGSCGETALPGIMSDEGYCENIEF